MTTAMLTYPYEGGTGDGGADAGLTCSGGCNDGVLMSSCSGTESIGTEQITITTSQELTYTSTGWTGSQSTTEKTATGSTLFTCTWTVTATLN
jgi:hypothetical protein